MKTLDFMPALPGLALAAACLICSAQTVAAPAAPTRATERSVTVRFPDLNLESREGARVLYGRIRSAATTVCGSRMSVWDARRRAEWKECYRATVDAAVRRVDRPMLTRLHGNLETLPAG